jgi:cyclopropane fatty-acyl-phospholipid synthase-like methyltransferase
MTDATNINNRFFKGSYKQAWKGLIPPGLTEAEVDFIEEIAALKNGDLVLDLMCGYGRHSIELARREKTVTAVDNLGEYIHEIDEAAKKEKLKIQTQTTNVLRVELEGKYAAAICMGNSFAFFNREDASKLLSKISSHLNPGSVFIINSWMIAEIAIRHFKEKDWHYAGDFKCVLEYEFCFHPSRIESQQTIIAKDGAIEVLNGVDYILTLDELEEMFNAAGLKTKGLYSTPRKRRFAMGDSQIYIVAERI